ncbi:MAG: 30S ribosomal protein S15 [Pseudomonadota bacterium]|jgi:small subunit ribosomal protein S15
MESSGDVKGTESRRTTGVVTADDVAVGSMRLSEKDPTDVVKQFQINSQDCGSPEVQIALLTRRLEVLTQHFAKFPKDLHSRKGMMDIISRRKQMLAYLKREDVARYRNTISALGLRK